MTRKGILLAGGHGSRLWPLTLAVNKHLLPIYDKPMVYYPLSALILAGIRDILIISTSIALPQFQTLFGNGEQLGLSISYATQDSPRGIADAILVGEEFIGQEPFALILGDNVFYGNDLTKEFEKVSGHQKENTIFGYYIENPLGLGVVVLDEKNNAIDIVEKPAKVLSNWVIPGFYFYTGQVVEVAKELTVSKRKELEISDLNRKLLDQGDLTVQLFGRGTAWFDSGTPDSLLEATEFVKVVENRTGLKICCPEEIAFRKGFIDKRDFVNLIKGSTDSRYTRYLQDLLNNH